VAWDWRRDPIYGVQRLDEVVKMAQARHPKAKLNLVSHSYGSLIAAYYLRYGCQDYFSATENWHGLRAFNQVILSATPFRGLMAMFRNMLNGFRFGLNTNLQKALAFCTFESSYYLLPPPGFDRVKNANGESLSLRLHEAERWQEMQWGLFHEKLKLPADNSQVRLNFKRLHLSRAQKFYHLMEAPLGELPWAESSDRWSQKLLYLYGYGFKTVNEGVWLDKHSRSNIFLYNRRDFARRSTKFKFSSVFSDGDQTVPAYSAPLPSALVDLGFESRGLPQSHLEVLQHSSAQKLIVEFLRR
jgi:pimeloyl-ACP methyl ester carboxylesterase